MNLCDQLNKIHEQAWAQWEINEPGLNIKITLILQLKINLNMLTSNKTKFQHLSTRLVYSPNP